MSTESNVTKSPLDVIKWLASAVLLSAAVVGNIYFGEIAERLGVSPSLIVQVLAVVALMGLSGLAALSSSQGKAFSNLVKEANIERRKVVWPTRQETIQTTLLVVAVVFVTGLILWGIDSVLGWFTRLLIG